MDRHQWRRTHNGNYLREVGPFTLVVYRRSGKWGWFVKSQSDLRASVFEAKLSAFEAIEQALQSLEPPMPTGRFRTVDPFPLDSELIDE